MRVGLMWLLALVGTGTALEHSGPETAFGRPERNDGALLLSSRESFALVDSARTHLLAYRMDAAEQLLYELEQRDDGAAAAWYYLTSAALHRALMSDEDEHFDTFHARHDTLVDVLGRHSPSKWRDYMRSEAGLWEAVAHLKRGRYVRGALLARSAYRGFERILGAYPDFTEAYKGYGLLRLGIGSMPRSYRFILNVFGYDGTIPQGLEEIRLAYEQSTYNREEAGIYLAFANTMLLLSEQDGLRIMEEFYRSDPTSTLYAHLYGFMLISNRHTEEAVEVLTAAVRRSETDAYFYNHYLDFYLAESHFRNDNFRSAETFYRRYLERHPGPALKAMAYLGLGRALEMQGRRSDATEHYEQVRAARTFDTDQASRRAAEQLLSEPLASIDSLLVMGGNAYDSGRYAEAQDILNGILAQPSASAEQQAEAAYRLARVYHARGEDAQAIAQYGRAVTSQADPRAKWAPWAWFYIGKIWESQGLPEQALEAYGRARAYGSSFDYSQALDQGIRAATELMDDA